MTDSGRSGRPVVGFISTWPLYQGTTMDPHARALVQGITKAANERGCDLILAAGVTSAGAASRWRSVWPVPAIDTDFVPVGPWNCDGLIVVPDDLSAAQSDYLQDLQASGFPITFTTPEAPGSRVSTDNRGGILQAVTHLSGHGHRAVAFVAGKRHRGGDSAERLAAFGDAMHACGLRPDPSLIAFGEHRRDSGRLAMRTILERGGDFSAVVASNDLSCLGAIDALTEVGLRVPQDIAAVGFDDILEARSHDPALTTIRNPTFAVGERALTTVLELVEGGGGTGSLMEPTRLIVRRSCGCQPERAAGARAVPVGREPREVLGEAMARAAYAEAFHLTEDELRLESHRLLEAIVAVAVADSREPVPLRVALESVFEATEARGDDPHLWQSAISELHGHAEAVDALSSSVDQRSILAAADLARSITAERAQRRNTQVLLEHMSTTSRLGLLTSQLLVAQDREEISRVLEEHLPGLGMQDLLACRYVPDSDDVGDRSEVVMAVGLPTVEAGDTFTTREFPPPAAFPASRPRRLLVLPLRIGSEACGFVAMTTSDPDVAAAVVVNLGSAIRASELFDVATAGRRMAEEANRVKSRFLATVGHELRTPLSVIVGLSDLVVREAREEAISPALQSDLERLGESATHLGQLISDVLDLAAGETGRLRLRAEDLDLCAALSEAVTVAREMVEGAGLRFEADLPEPGPRVLGDPTRLRQIVLNLVGNAVKYTPQGSVSLVVSGDDGHATITVTDTGIGVPSSEQLHVFSGFSRDPRPPVRGRSGLGIGLTIASDLVALHGGHLEVRSPVADGRGSAFSFSLPTLLEQAPERAGGRASSDANGRARMGRDGTTPAVLVVEDDAAVLDVHARLVREVGAYPLRASGGREALEVLGSAEVDLVMLDLGMPDGDGYGLLEAMRRSPATRDTPVIILTGQDLTDHDLERFDRAVVAVVSKGLLETTETRARIDAALARRRLLGASARHVVRRAALYIDHHHVEPITRDDVAREVAISPDYLTDCFRQELGVTPMTYLTRCRIRHARELLETTDEPVTAIGLAVGFSDASHFARTFRREVGVSPRTYRRSGSD